jgi:regulator of replication initiation timing
MLAEAAGTFALVALRAPPDVARVARLEIRARFLEKALAASNNDHAVLFEQMVESSFPGIEEEDKEIVRMACKAVLSDLEQEGRVVILGPVFMTRYAFQQKKLRLTGMLSQSERGTMEWGKVLDFIVGNGRGTLVGKQEWRKASKLLREGGALSCTSSRVQVSTLPKPLDLLYEWIALTHKPVELNSVLSHVTGVKGVLDWDLLEAARSDERFRVFGTYLWVESLAKELEEQWARSLDAARTALDARRWSVSNLPSTPDARGWNPPQKFSQLVEARLGELAEQRGCEMIGPGLWAKPLAFCDSAAQHFARLRKIETNLGEIREGLGLKGAAFRGRILYKLVRLLDESGFVRIGDRFVHRARLGDAIAALIASGAPEPVPWADVVANLRKSHKTEIGREEIRRVLEGSQVFTCCPEGIYLAERKASLSETQQSVIGAFADRGYAGDSAISARVKEDWKKIATPSEVTAALGGDRLYTRIYGGWALAPEFDWLADARAHLVASEAGQWAKGLIGRVNPEEEKGLVTSVERERGSLSVKTATFFITGADMLNSRLQIYWETSGLFPAGRFVATFRGPSGAEVTVRGDGGSALIQLPLGFWSSLGLQHGDEVRASALGGWPPRYDLSPTGARDPAMAEIAEAVTGKFLQATTACAGDMGTAMEAILEVSQTPLVASEICDALLLCQIRAERAAVVAYLGKYSYLVRTPGGSYRLDPERRGRYLLRIAELEEQVRKAKDDARQAETMILAFRGENARLKNENRELRNRVSSLEVERLKYGEVQQSAKSAIDRLNSQLKSTVAQNAASVKRISELETKIEELIDENRKMQVLLARPIWIKLLDAVKGLFKPSPRRPGVSA